MKQREWRGSRDKEPRGEQPETVVSGQTTDSGCQSMTAGDIKEIEQGGG